MIPPPPTNKKRNSLHSTMMRRIKDEGEKSQKGERKENRNLIAKKKIIFF
jgi:hypothetical protein